MTIPAPRELPEVRDDAEVVEGLAEGAMLASVVVLRRRPSGEGEPLARRGRIGQIDAAAQRIGESRSTTVERLAEVGLPLLG